MCIRQRIGGSNPPLTAIFEKELVRKYGLFFRILHICGGMRNPRPGFDYWRSQLDRPGASRTGCPKGASNASQSPLTAIFEKELVRKYGLFFRILRPAGGDEKPRLGFDNWHSQLDRLRTQRAGGPKGEQSESIPPSPPYLRESSYGSTGFFFAYCALPGG